MCHTTSSLAKDALQHQRLLQQGAAKASDQSASEYELRRPPIGRSQPKATGPAGHHRQHLRRLQLATFLLAVSQLVESERFVFKATSKTYLFRTTSRDKWALFRNSRRCNYSSACRPISGDVSIAALAPDQHQNCCKMKTSLIHLFQLALCGTKPLPLLRG